jgi:hypothetical protein
VVVQERCGLRIYAIVDRDKVVVTLRVERFERERPDPCLAGQISVLLLVVEIRAGLVEQRRQEGA